MILWKLNMKSLPEKIKNRLEICKNCPFSTYEEITQDDPPNAFIRITGNTIASILKELGIKALRCKLCGCFMHLKAAIMKDGGCPLGKW